VILHEPRYSLGLFDELVRQLAEMEVVDAQAPGFGEEAWEKADGVISLGGDMSALDDQTFPFIRREIDLLHSAHGRGIPILGICLGAQLLARALDGDVRPGSGREIGWLDVEFIEADDVVGPAGCRSRFLWHFDSIGLPPGATALARTAECWQAFRVGSSYGVQFHPEVGRDWARVVLRSPASPPITLTEAERIRVGSGPTREAEDDAARLLRAFLGIAGRRATSRDGEGTDG
jgi:GMP synthase (glutamine-hydrolysing)